MSTAAATHDPTHDATILATVARHRAMLGEMAEIALELARWLKDQVMGGLFKGRNPVAQLEMLGRTLRQILAMDELIAEDPRGIVKLFNKMIGRREAAERKAAAEPVALAEQPAPTPPAPPSDTPKAPRAENLLGDLFDPLFQLRDKPIGEIIAGICRDIGVDPDRYQWELGPDPEPAPPLKPKATAKTNRLFGTTAIRPPEIPLMRPDQGERRAKIPAPSPSTQASHSAKPSSGLKSAGSRHHSSQHPSSSADNPTATNLTLTSRSPASSA